MKKLTRIIILIYITMMSLIAVTAQADFQALVAVPETLTVESLAEIKTSISEKDVVLIDIMNKARIQWADEIAWNTRPYKGYKLISITGNTSLARLNMFFAQFGIKWRVMCANDGYKTVGEGEDQKRVVNTLFAYDPAVMINFIQRDRVYDKEGNFVKEVEPTKIELVTFAGSPRFEAKK